MAGKAREDVLIHRHDALCTFFGSGRLRAPGFEPGALRWAQTRAALHAREACGKRAAGGLLRERESEYRWGLGKGGRGEEAARRLAAE
jgi:hypothetical protein